MVNKMKRILAALLVAFLIAGTAAAETTKQKEFRKRFITLETSELLEVNQVLQSILFERILPEGVRVPQGTYIIGEDIPAGTYRIEITDGTGYYDVYDKQDGKLIHSGLTGKSYKVTEIGKITFEDGNVLKLVNSTFIFYPYTGIFH